MNEPKLCACGCGEPCKRKYVNGHWANTADAKAKHRIAIHQVYNATKVSIAKRARVAATGALKAKALLARLFPPLA